MWGIVQLAINCIIIVITKCYQTADRQRLLFIYRDICTWPRYTYVFQTTNVTKIISCKQPIWVLPKCFQRVWCKSFQAGLCLLPDKRTFKSSVKGQRQAVLTKWQTKNFEMFNCKFPENQLVKFHDVFQA